MTARSCRSRRAADLAAGKAFTVRVDYAGTPAVVTDPDGSIEGWIPTDDGAIVVNEPQGSPAWFPVNDNPRDKATYDFAITVPAGDHGARQRRAALLGDQRRQDDVVLARELDPMAPYLATATNGRFDLDTQTGPNGLPIYNAVDAKADSGEGDAVAALQGARDRVVLQRPLRRVPVRRRPAGSSTRRPTSATRWRRRPSPSTPTCPTRSTVVHELSHMWFGDAVTLTEWPDIWLHEGFATFSEWIWTERHGGQTAQQAFDERYADKQFPWSPAPGRARSGRRSCSPPRSTTAAA